MLARLPRACRPAFFAAIVLGSVTPAVRASSILYHVTDLGAAGAVALNDAGQVALNQDSGGATRAVLYNSYGANAGRMTFVGQGLPGVTSPSTNNFATALNAAGQAVVATPIGSFLTDGQSYQATSPTPISDPRLLDGLTVRGNASNAQGMVVGINSLGQAALFDGSKLITLETALADVNTPLNLTGAIAINAMGQILAEGSGGSGSGEHAYLLTPSGMAIPPPPTMTPEPGTLAILGLAAGVGWLRRRTARRMIEGRGPTVA